jgi:DNA-binding NarL/FixJ family response regulator
VSSEDGLVGGQIRSRLTPKELQIVELIVQGYKNKDIAKKLKNSEQVIKNYLRAIFDKTGSSDRLELALLAIHHRVLGPPSAGAGLEKPRVAIQAIHSRRASAGL